MTAKILGPIGQAAFERRGISSETAVRHEIYTASHKDGQVVPDHYGTIVVFPFTENGTTVNEKYRGPGKRFWQWPNGKRTFWNNDAINDPSLEDGSLALVITEGEIDALTAIDCGFPLAVSVPDGAPPASENSELEPLDPEQERQGKFEFLYRNRDALKRIKRFILAVDNDLPGQRLAQELVRRLSPARCLFVTYPDGCKDLNDVRVKYSPEEVSRVINAAKRYPVRGLYYLSNYPDSEPLKTYFTGWDTLDKHLRLFFGEFMVVTGKPGDGKSTFVLNLLVKLAERYGHKAAIFSPEMRTVPHLRGKLRRILGGRELEADHFIEKRFVFIDSDPSGYIEEDFDLDWIIDRAIDAVLRDGIRILLIDPWNEVEHSRRRGEPLSEYVSRGIRQLKRFAREYDVMVIVICHPTKEVGKDGNTRPVTLYDCADSAAWNNKADHGVIVERPDPMVDETTIRVAKVRFDETGERGEIKMRFDRISCRFEMLDEVTQPETS